MIYLTKVFSKFLNIYLALFLSTKTNLTYENKEKANLLTHS